jgi:hypothetical protein
MNGLNRVVKRYTEDSSKDAMEAKFPEISPYQSKSVKSVKSGGTAVHGGQLKGRDGGKVP